MILSRPFDWQIVNFLNQLRVAGKVIAHGEARKLNAIATYMRSQALQDAYRIVPMKSAQNVGSGATAHGFGGASADPMTLFDSPTWGAGGIAFNGTSQYGTIPDFLTSETITVFARVTQSNASPAGNQAFASQYNATDNFRSWTVFHAGVEVGKPYGINRSSDGTTAADKLEQYRSAGSLGSTSDRVLVAQWVAGGGRSLWFDDTPISLSLSAGTAQTVRFNSSNPIAFGCHLLAGGPTAFAEMTAHALSIVKGSITDLQRTTLRGLISAL